MERERPPGGQVILDAPPPPPDPAPGNPLARLMPVAMIAAMIGMAALHLTSGGPAARSPMFLFLPAMMGVSVIGTLVHGARGTGRIADVNTRRAEYLRYLDGIDAGLIAGAAAQHEWLHRHHPDPSALWTIAGSPRMWERSEHHPEFCRVRVGVGAVAAATVVVAPELAADDGADPVTTGAVRRLLGNRSEVTAVPVCIALSASRVVTVAGDHESCRAVARALVCQLALSHHPELIGVEVAAGPGAAAMWDWLKWLPHVRVPQGRRHRVVIVDGAERPRDGADATTVVEISPASPGAAVTVRADADGICADYDGLCLPGAVACARRIARWCPDPGRARRTAVAADWLSLMAIEDPETVDVARLWAPRPGRDTLRVPIGVAEDGTIVALDIKEAAAGGMGPHGLCVGATGSGKSEFLRTLTLGMIAAHPPDVLNLVLIDFKGGATFLGLEKCRHVSAVITNLADEAPLVERMRDALAGEINRRQEMLRAAGNITDIAEYQRARARHPGLAPLPALFVVVDEFSEMLSRHPDFAELFVAIGRLGRSLGIHLLLASQRLDEGRLRGLETHLSYRICLKTFSASDSRAVLGMPDAYHLPAQPGAAYLKTATGEITRLQTAFVSGGYTPRPPTRSTGKVVVQRFTLQSPRHAPVPDTGAAQQPLLGTVLNRLAGRGRTAHRIWLPPLTRSPALDDLLLDGAPAPLQVPIGIIDCPFEQRYELMIADLSGAAGNAVVVGAPQSGKSTTLRTIVSALAATHGAGAVQFYCLDFGGGSLSALRDLPHVGSVAGRRDGDLCRRTVAQLESVLRSREAARRLGGESFAEYRTLGAADPTAFDDPYGDVFLVVDGWATVRQEFDTLEPAITALAAQGLSYGIHVLLAASRWADLRPALKDQIGTRIELRLGDAAESEMDRRRARDLVAAPPGRGLTRAGREMAVALPCSGASTADGVIAPRVEMLPAEVDHRTLTDTPRGSGQVVIGLGERDLRPVVLDFAEHPHLLILGEGECGKTALLRTLCTELAGADRAAHLEIVDYRRTLLGVVESGPRTGYSVSPTALTARLAALTARLTGRMPDEHVTQQQLRDRSWWQGPDIFVLVDDYDLVAGATGNPLTPLADFLPHARDLGLHVIVARRSGGAARAMFDPVLARLRDMGCSGMMMSAAPDEGVLLGSVRPAPLPPGRGVLSVRGRPDELVQAGWLDPP